MQQSTGYLNKEMLLELFSEDNKDTTLHIKYNLSEQDFKMITETFGGFKCDPGLETEGWE